VTKIGRPPTLYPHRVHPAMETPVGDSSTVSNSHTLSPSIHERNSSKLSLAAIQPFEVSEVEAATPHPRDSWKISFLKRFQTHHPHFYTRFSRSVRYVRGPRPKVGLPGTFIVFSCDLHLTGVQSCGHCWISISQ
jgi:hypothetical protein